MWNFPHFFLRVPQQNIFYYFTNIFHCCSIQDLPREVLRTVLKSDRLVLVSARGNVVPGIQREVRVAAIIEQYLSRHCTVVKLRQGSGKDGQGMVLRAKGHKA